MEGRIGSVLAETLVPYRPRMTRITERVTATILLQQIIYRWDKERRPFYKFRAPCTHDRYREGDSWTEELEFSPAEFDTALKTIGTKITKGDSRTAALAGKEASNLVLYWTDSNRMTWYELNEPLLEELLAKAYSDDANCGKCKYIEDAESESSIEFENPELHSSEITPEITHNNAASPRQAQLQEDDCSIEIYYRDKTKVKSVGTVSRGPWEVVCPSCGNDVRIDELDVPVGCLCGMHEFTLLSKKPHIPVRQKKPGAVDAYYAIVKSRGVRHGANEEFETDIAAAVTDLTRWRQVVKEYIHPDVGGNPYAVDKMLVYYNEERLPGSRRAREQDTAPGFTLLEADT